jgi:hypothetical protein
MRVDAQSSGELHENGFAEGLYSRYDVAPKAILKALKVGKKEAHLGCYSSRNGALNPICRATDFRPFGHGTPSLVGRDRLRLRTDQTHQATSTAEKPLA